MALTILMFVILIVSFALMFGLVRFTDNVITMDPPDDADRAGPAISDLSPRR
jgi:hypothetical protein